MAGRGLGSGRRSVDLLDDEDVEIDVMSSPASNAGSLSSGERQGWVSAFRLQLQVSPWFSSWLLLDWLVCGVLLLSVEIPVNLFATPHEVFFITDDFAQSYPLMPNTIPNWLLMVLIIIPPILVTISVLVRRLSFENKVHEIHHGVLSWLQAITINFLVCDALKYSCGRHRPDYFARMQREDASPTLIKDASLSFPSGHSSSSFAVMTFLFLYACGKTRVFYRGHFSQLIVIAIPLYIALFVAISRVQDYRHNYSDIVAGALLGLISGLIGYLMNFPSVLHRRADIPRNKKAVWASEQHVEQQ